MRPASSHPLVPVLPGWSFMLSQVVSRKSGGDPEPVESGEDASARRLLDQDIAQVERLAGLDGEVLADLDALVGPLRSRSR